MLEEEQEKQRRQAATRRIDIDVSGDPYQTKSFKSLIYLQPCRVQKQGMNDTIENLTILIMTIESDEQEKLAPFPRRDK
mgnify:CR=1 FL=1